VSGNTIIFCYLGRIRVITILCRIDIASVLGINKLLREWEGKVEFNYSRGTSNIFREGRFASKSMLFSFQAEGIQAGCDLFESFP